MWMKALEGPTDVVCQFLHERAWPLCSSRAQGGQSDLVEFEEVVDFDCLVGRWLGGGRESSGGQSDRRFVAS